MNRYLKHEKINQNIKEDIKKKIIKWKEEILELGGGKNNIDVRATLRLKDCENLEQITKSSIKKELKED